MPSFDVKVTVLKKVQTCEILKEYGASTVEMECPVVKEGVEYISKGGKMPEGFLRLGLGRHPEGHRRLGVWR